MATRSRTRTKADSVLVNLAESIGSTLGTLAAKADAAQKALTASDIASSIGREGQKLVRSAKEAVVGTKKTPSRRRRRSNAGDTGKRGGRKRNASRKTKSARTPRGATAKRLKRAGANGTSGRRAKNARATSARARSNRPRKAR
jgi:hypothetical protein